MTPHPNRTGHLITLCCFGALLAALPGKATDPAHPQETQIQLPPGTRLSFTDLVFTKDAIILSICKEGPVCRVFSYIPQDGSWKLGSERTFDEKDGITIPAGLEKGVTDQSVFFGNQILAVPGLASYGALEQGSYVYSSGGGLLGVNDKHGWCVLNEIPHTSCYRKGTGELLAVGYGTAVVQQGTAAFAIDLATEVNRKLPYPSRCPLKAKVLSDSYLATSECGKTIITDRAGAEKLRLKKFGPLGYDLLDLSNDGHTLAVFRHQYRRSIAGKLADDTIALATLGVGEVNQDSNVSDAEVIDMDTKKIYWHRSLYHSEYKTEPKFALSPTGSDIAYVFDGKLVVAPTGAPAASPTR